jgi:glyoxylase-like metal-dependent hydrolase (beta-lactamase superfamily II)
MELREIARGVFACLVPDRGWGWSNTGFVADGGGLMVDTLLDVASTRRALALYAQRVPEAPGRLVNTHHNIDHCWGNQLFRGKEIIGHRECAARMGRDLSPAAVRALLASADAPPGVRWMARDFAAFDFDGIEVTPPNRIVDGDTEIDLGGLAARLLYVGPAHTAGDLVVHVPERGVVFAGDVIFRLCTPVGWEGTFAGWIAALERIAALAPEWIVPGHGPLCGVEGALELRDYLRYVFDESKRFHAQGLALREAARRIDLGRFARWNQPGRLVFQVARAYRELEGGAFDAPVDAVRLLDEAWALECELRGPKPASPSRP